MSCNCGNKRISLFRNSRRYDTCTNCDKVINGTCIRLSATIKAIASNKSVNCPDGKF